MQPHYITQHYTTLITLHHITLQLQLPLHCTTRHHTTTTTTLQYTRLHYTIPRYSTQHYSTLQYTTLITPHHNYDCNYTTLITLHYNYNLQLQLHYNYNCTTPHYIQQLWRGDRCNHCNLCRKHNSNHLSVHQWVRSAIRESQQPTLPIGFLFLNFRYRFVRHYWYQIVINAL